VSARGEWIDAEFGMSPATALRLMNVFKTLGPQIANGSVFDAGALYALAAPSTPPEVRTGILVEIAPHRASIGKLFAASYPGFTAKTMCNDRGNDDRARASWRAAINSRTWALLRLIPA
jgi:hypothetical protein